MTHFNFFCQIVFPFIFKQKKKNLHNIYTHWTINCSLKEISNQPITWQKVTAFKTMISGGADAGTN